MRKTKNSTLEAAASCALELHEESDEDWVDVDESCKMVLIVNSSLNMGVGKLAAQVRLIQYYRFATLNNREIINFCR